MFFFASKNKCLRTGRLASNQYEALGAIWKELTVLLNSVGDGPVREINEWKKVFTEWKCSIRKKARENKALNDNEKRLLKLTGNEAVEGLTGVEEIGIGFADARNEEINEVRDDGTNEEEILISIENEDIDDQGQTRRPTARIKKRTKKTSSDVLLKSYTQATKSQFEGLEKISCVTHEQFELYLTFLQKKEKFFFTLCENLNKITNAAKKTVQQWRKTFDNWVRYVKRKARKIFVYRYITGGGGALYVVLTNLEERLLHVLGNVNVNGFKNVIELGLGERKTKLKKKISTEIGSPKAKDKAKDSNPAKTVVTIRRFNMNTEEITEVYTQDGDVADALNNIPNNNTSPVQCSLNTTSKKRKMLDTLGHSKKTMEPDRVSLLIVSKLLRILDREERPEEGGAGEGVPLRIEDIIAVTVRTMQNQRDYSVRQNDIINLIPEFAGTEEEDVLLWLNRIRAVRRNYGPNYNELLLAAISKLSGFAKKWFDSRPEHLDLSLAELMEMISTFGNREDRLSCMKRFEARKWRRNEKFLEYYQDKLLLGNQLQLSEQEILKYMIDGLDNCILQTQAKMARFTSLSEFMKVMNEISGSERQAGANLGGSSGSSRTCGRQFTTQTKASSAVSGGSHRGTKLLNAADQEENQEHVSNVDEEIIEYETVQLQQIRSVPPYRRKQIPPPTSLTQYR
ncbi:hypothetical protein TcasGA2_TC033925 [Tribolium castaneum]|uniref:Regulatory protein zeste n=1 Tax=Tribolium castaneum TaxID=7070 RepID=A0A139WDN4_TRICA|nr:hypothetical protein TcasGA2_TC033925 [Tribolium castaneum]